MSQSQAGPPTTLAQSRMPDVPPQAREVRHRCNPECRSDHQFVGMLAAFHATGGLLPRDAVTAWFRAYGGRSTDDLDRRIAAREVIAFDWRSDLWLPMFQFNRTHMCVREALQPVLHELSAIYDGWETASWFALPNSCLGGRPPVDLLVRSLPAVWYAARLDRFIAAGDSTWDHQTLPSGRIELIAAGATESGPLDRHPFQRPGFMVS